MTEFVLEDLSPKPVMLALDQRVTLGAAGKAPDEQSDRISLGRPRCRPLTVGDVDDESRAFLEQHPSSTYWLLDLLCSFRADEEAPLQRAWLEVVLTLVETSGDTEPTAWSMEPLSLSDPVQISQVVKLDGSLKLTSPVVPIDIGLGDSRETKTTFEQRAAYVEAYREGTSRPSWWFVRTPVTEIRGVHRLRTVVELPAGRRARAVVSAGATLRLKVLGLIPYRTPLGDVPEALSVEFGAVT